MKYTPVKEIYIPRDKVESVIAPWIVKVLLRLKKEELQKKNAANQ